MDIPSTSISARGKKQPINTQNQFPAERTGVSASPIGTPVSVSLISYGFAWSVIDELERQKLMQGDYWWCGRSVVALDDFTRFFT